MPTSVTQIPGSIPPAAPSSAAANDHGFGFHDFLSAMNPLQYLPVIGTIYRAVTGDVIPEALRDAGSLLVSGLMGGPIGLITYIATTIAEKVTGIDPEQIVAGALTPAHAAVTAAAATQPAPPPAAATAPATTPAADPAPAIAPPPAPRALTQEQLAAYGVGSGTSGTLKPGNVEGADVLNLMELVRLGKVRLAYAGNQHRPAAGG